MDLTELWQKSLEILRQEIAPVSFETWIVPIKPIAVSNSTVILKIDDSFIKNTVETKYYNLIENTIKHLMGSNYKIAITETENINTEEKAQSNKPEKQKSEFESNLNPKYVFSTFVVGNSNRLAHAAALAVAESPATAYNPFFLYGGVGLGKTHLMHSIAHYILENNPNAKVLYVSCEKFTNELINSIRDDKNEEFRRKYRNIDVLLIDDIQFISQKERTQEEFFHTFNALYDAHKQIIISSDRPPKEIKTLEERLRSRFEWGLIADINPPDYETRIAILKKKAENDNIVVNDEVYEYIAKNIVSNIRELEGALTRVVAYSQLTQEKISKSLAENALKDIFSDQAAIEVTPDRIQEVVAAYYNIRPEDITGSKRSSNIAYPRQIAMYLTRRMLDISLPKIGESFGGRDHTTVIHAINKIDDNLKKDKNLQSVIFELENRIKGE
ncbi:chromosomal replication initiator protein DnaA [Anaerotignum sp. MSJ-24]|uniref:chromosomal replication initiator protein DnaA n=1 Tax=Anaerotignum sp. MSJ-24 TaxID=2841521 RepID=UPI001C11F06C|nr:chromosomal replication initiator protein DnaA [Anaerotignum sp. MSJ-24]MBD9220157.1 chromosomal replication initiator protein DnaA [Clostridiales bacterium]MBU5463915.1 chromosomal replication initiator protein DnaA [Anaerotignum sp. MSJ-24]